MMRVPVIFVTFGVIYQAALASAKHIKGDNSNVGVYGGDFIRIEDAPWMALVYTSEKVPCAGTIVDREFILTVDTCCSDRGTPRSSWKALVGSNGRTLSGISVKIQDAYRYTEAGDYNLKPSLCLLKLEKPLKYDQKIQQASLEEPSIVISDGTEVDFVAFGRPDKLDVTRGLRRATLPISDVDWCKQENKRLGGGQICAGDHDHNACAGDAGGALTSGRNLIGVLSEATSDCRSNPSRFCRISFYRPWINKTIQGNK